MEDGKWRLQATRREVEQGWRAVGDILASEGHTDLTAEVRSFLQKLRPPQTEREQIAATLRKHVRVAMDR